MKVKYVIIKTLGYVLNCYYLARYGLKVSISLIARPWFVGLIFISIKVRSLPYERHNAKEAIRICLPIIISIEQCLTIFLSRKRLISELFVRTLQENCIKCNWLVNIKRRRKHYYKIVVYFNRHIPQLCLDRTASVKLESYLLEARYSKLT